MTACDFTAPADPLRVASDRAAVFVRKLHAQGYRAALPFQSARPGDFQILEIPAGFRVAVHSNGTEPPTP